jgi:hypothetical protein
MALISVIMIAGCWHSPASRQPLTNTTAPRAVAPIRPDVTAAELGIWGPSGVFQRTFDIPLHAGSVFGWRVNLPCRSGTITVEEELHLPAPGDWPADTDMRISKDLKSVSMRYEVECRSGWIEKQWSVAAGDPPGLWTIRVTPVGFAPKVFRAMFTKDVLAPPPRP